MCFAIASWWYAASLANLLSVGAIDFGLVVDATVIMVENIFRHLSQSSQTRDIEHPALHRMRSEIGLHGKFAVMANAATEVNRAIFFSAAIIIAGFVPLFTLSGVEGHIFGPMAKTYAYAIAGGLLATFTISPALSAFLLPERVEEVETFVVRGLRRVYQPVLNFALANRVLTLGAAGLLVVLALLCRQRAGPGISAQARRGQFLDPRHHAALDFARGRQ